MIKQNCSRCKEKNHIILEALINGKECAICPNCLSEKEFNTLSEDIKEIIIKSRNVGQV